MTEPASPAPLTPAVGLGVVHLFCKPAPVVDTEALIAAVKSAEAEGCQIVPVSILGHKADVAFMALHADMRALRRFQSGVQAAGLEVIDSYVSLTEVSEYAKGMPEHMLQPRLHPQLPPEGKDAFCFYPMSKKRDGHANWFTLPYEQRSELMQEHGKSGRTFAGRLTQIITGSAGLDDYEWGVTLFGVRPDDLKEVVYTMRFDEASAVYAEFGPFYVGAVTPIEHLAATL
jgi:hydrogen peroxide-dependent heme synthase